MQAYQETVSVMMSKGDIVVMKVWAHFDAAVSSGRATVNPRTLYKFVHRHSLDIVKACPDS
jgi:hypothetical protein